MPAIPKSMKYTANMISPGEGIVEKLYVAPTNGPSFVAGSSYAEFRIPGGREYTFADLSRAYIQLSLSTAADITCTMDMAGVINCIDRIEIDSTSGIRLLETYDKNIIDNLLIIDKMDQNDLANTGAVMFGSRANTAAVGVAIAAAAKTFVLPIMNTSINKMIPMFGNDGIRIRVHWAAATNFLIQTTGTNVVTAATTFSNLSLHYDSVKLSPSAMEALNSEVGGEYILTGSDFVGQSDVMTSTALNMNLGFGRSKCKKIYACIRTTAAITAVANSAHSFALSTLTSAELKYNGRLINLTGWTFAANATAVIAAENMKAKGGTFMNPGGTFTDATFNVANMGTRTAAQQTGTFFLSWDLTTGADTEFSPSGLDVRTGAFQLTLGASATPDATVNVFCEYENMIVLDMKSDRVFRVMS
jgi:hypothetical protein